jgi:hypothetical protein
VSTRQQRRANRRNAQLSTGPKTPEGLAASARNATTHGLSSSFRVLPHEDQSAFARLLDTLARELTPTTEHEKFLVTQMAESRWRLDRISRFEAVAYEHLFEQPHETNPDHVIVLKLGSKTANVFDLLQRYATAAERSYYKAHRELTQGRKNEKRNEPTEVQTWLEQQLSKPNPHSMQEMTEAVNQVLEELNQKSVCELRPTLVSTV